MFRRRRRFRESSLFSGQGGRLLRGVALDDWESAQAKACGSGVDEDVVVIERVGVGSHDGVMRKEPCRYEC
jgi:hypothetical protein